MKISKYITKVLQSFKPFYTTVAVTFFVEASNLKLPITKRTHASNIATVITEDERADSLAKISASDNSCNIKETI